MPRRHTRKKRSAGVFGALIAVLIGVILIFLIIFAILRIGDTKVARYPVLYTELITAAANENAVPAPYIAAVIMAESSYDPEAVSSVGAQGLMQIMPDTGDWIAGKFGEDVSDGALFTPEVSIRYGAWYLGFLLSRYDGDMRCATAAYHAGQGTVDKWLKNPEYSADGETLDHIPYDSTSAYVARVLKYYDYYVKAYDEITVQ